MQSTPRWKYDKKNIPVGTLFWVDKTNDVRQVMACSKCHRLILVPWLLRSLPSVNCRSCSPKS